MRQLHVLGVSDDGDALLLGPGASSGKPSHRVRVDDRLRAAVRGQLNRPGTDSHRAEIALSPREIQARLRAGETPEQVAKAAGVPVARLMPYVAPVEAERQRIVDDARAAHLHRSRGPAGARPLGETVDAHLAAVAGLKPDTVEWSASRRRDGAWVVSLAYSARGGRRAASWLWRPLERDLTGLDVAATRLSADETPTVRRKPAARPTTATAPARKKSSARPAKKSAKKPSAKKAAAKSGAARTSAAAKSASTRKRAASKAATTRQVATGRKAAATKAATARKAATAGKAATNRTAATARKAAATKAATARKAATAGKAATARKAATPPPAPTTATQPKATPTRKAAAAKATTRKAAATKAPARKAGPVRKVAARKTATPAVNAPNRPFRPTLVETPPNLAPVADPAPEPVVEPAAQPVVQPAAQQAPVAEPVAAPAAAAAAETRPNVVVVPPPAPPRKAGQRVPVPSWSDVLLGVQPHRDDDASKG